MANRRGTGVAAVGVAAAAAFLLFGRGGGFGGGWGLLPSNSSSAVPAQESTQVEEQVKEQVEEQETDAVEQDSVLTIRVRENQIFFEEEPVTPEELEDQLLRAYAEGMEVELVDDGAIKADYDAAVSILDKLNIPYSIR